MLQSGYLTPALLVPDDCPGVAPATVHHLIAVVAVPVTITDREVNIILGLGCNTGG